MNWTKISDKESHLKQGDTLIATMKFQNRKAECHIGERIFQIRKKGFWGNQVELSDENGQILSVLKPTNWFSSTCSFSLYGHEYQMIARNKPLVEYVVQQTGRDLLAYGLKVPQKTASAVITDSRQTKSYELDLLLWFLFAPVALSETGNCTAADEELLLLIA